MKNHLSAQELVEATEGALGLWRRTHLDTCDTCRRELSDIRALMKDVEAAADLPEPSPLFWDHFSKRVRQATVDLPPPTARSWWSGAWRPVAALAAGVAAVMLVLVLRSGPATGTDTSAVDATLATVEPLLDEGPWELVVGLASELAWEDVQKVAMPRAGTADALINELTPKQRQELAKMLRAEIGDLE